jgi:hypothetical protein
VLAALLVAALVTGFEAISLEGADNLFVPLAVVVILGKITTKPLSEVVFQNLSLLAICLAIGLAVWRFRSFNVGGAIAFILFAYGTWSLGSWVWALPVLVGFAGYLAAWRRFALPGHGSAVKVRNVARALLPPFTMLLLANSLGRYETFFAPYLATSAAVIAFSLNAGVFLLQRRRSWALGALGLALFGTFLAVAGHVPRRGGTLDRHPARSLGDAAGDPRDHGSRDPGQHRDRAAGPGAAPQPRMDGLAVPAQLRGGGCGAGFAGAGDGPSVGSEMEVKSRVADA